MKKGFSLLLAITLLAPSTSWASSIKPGAKCAKIGQTQISSGYVYVCMKIGSKLVWSKGAKLPVPQTNPKTNLPSTPQTLSPIKPTKSAQDIWNELTPKDPGLGPVSNLSAQFDQNSGNVLITWDFDFLVGNNKSATEFSITPIAGGTNYAHTFKQAALNKDSKSQSYVLLARDLDSWLNTPSVLSSLSVTAVDDLGHTGQPMTVNNISCVSNLPPPVIVVTH